MITHLDHVAIATGELEQAIRRLRDDLGLALSGREELSSQGTETAFFELPGTRIELLQPMEDGGPVAGFLARRGPGLHHVCFRSDDIDADVARLRRRGWRFTTPAPVPGAGGGRVIFAHPRSAGGVLIELAQAPGTEDPCTG